MVIDAESRCERVWIGLAFVLTGLGSAGTGYLLWLHLARPNLGFDVCSEIFNSDCDLALRTQLGSFLGIPLAGWGLVHFSIVLALLLMATLLGASFRREGLLAIVMASSAASLIGVALSAIMLNGVVPVCMVCVGVHAANLLLAPVAFLAGGGTLSECAVALFQGGRWLFGGTVAESTLARWKLLGLFMALLVGVAVYQWVQIQVDRRASAWSVERVIAEFQAGPVFDIPLDAADARLGPANAKARLVVFSDFECPACRTFAIVLRQLVKDFPDVQVVFRHYPLTSSCNPGAKSDFHPLSCTAAYAAEAARRQGRFWEYHNAAFDMTDKLDSAALLTLAKEVGLDLDRFNADRKADAVKARIRADCALGNKLAIAGTPTVFLNGRLLDSRSLPLLRELLKQELGAATAR